MILFFLGMELGESRVSVNIEARANKKVPMRLWLEASGVHKKTEPAKVPPFPRELNVRKNDQLNYQNQILEVSAKTNHPGA